MADAPSESVKRTIFEWQPPSELVDLTLGVEGDDERVRGQSPAWKKTMHRRLLVTDATILIGVVLGAVVLRFGGAEAKGSLSGVAGRPSFGYVSLGVGIAVAWWLTLGLYRTREAHVLGHGAEEYRRVFRATIILFGWLAILSLVLKLDMSRGYLAIAFPLGLICLLLGRKMWRKRLCKERAAGGSTSNVLVIGGVDSAQHLAKTLDKQPLAGYRVSGVWLPDRHGSRHESMYVSERHIPVFGTQRTLAEAIAIGRSNAVVVTDTEHLGPEGLKSLAYQLEGIDIDLIVAPNVIDVAGSRIQISGVAGMPFLLLQEPQYSAAGGFAKTLFDRVFALAALILVSPLLLVAALAIKFGDGGPILYKSERIGQGGNPFCMLKFRSMHIDADHRVAELDDNDVGAGPMFKVRADPRVTPVGRFLRKHSIDELPQLVNVLRGDMSMVGPRPPLPSEVREYDDSARRRLLVKQGLTGLWQVSGRSDLDWEDAVRLDLDYVDNWSMIRDLQIIWQTVRAVIRSEGAY